MSETTLTLFAVGGTGALAVEPLLHLCAAGLGPDRLLIILVDADAGNPALARAIDLIVRYQKVREEFGSPSKGFFRTALEKMKSDVLTPLGGKPGSAAAEMTLRTYVDKANMQGDLSPAGWLLDLLFSPNEQREQLREGFRGHPAIGSVLMHGLKDAPEFKRLTQDARNNNGARFFAVGSIFGGTGAAGLPVISRLLAMEGITPDRIGAAIVTPYYSLERPSTTEEQDHRLKPDSSRFLRATAAALPTYLKGLTKFGEVYVLGDELSLPYRRKAYSAGGSGQSNDPHLVELFAALAAIRFATQKTPATPFCIRYLTVDSADPSLASLPHESHEQFLAFIVATNFFVQYFGVERSGADEQRLMAELRMMPFLQHIQLGPDFVRESSQALSALGMYCRNVWQYLWTVTTNQKGLRVVNFDTHSATRIELPNTYASGAAQDMPTVMLPRVDNCLTGFNPPNEWSLLRRGDPKRLASLAELFTWYNKLSKPPLQGLPGLLWYLNAGSQKFVKDWYSRGVA